MLKSIVCRYADFKSPWYQDQELNLMTRRIFFGHSAMKFDFVSRKFWERCAIAQALDERCLLRTGMKGLGFAVGTEPLVSHFAGRGCQILATDLAAESSDENWIATGQHAASKEILFQPLLVNSDIFDQRLSFQSVGMRTLNGLDAGYDFIWSSCALEHLGTLQSGLDFIVRSARLLIRVGSPSIQRSTTSVRTMLRLKQADRSFIAGAISLRLGKRWTHAVSA
jgi:hypothetical protein